MTSMTVEAVVLDTLDTFSMDLLDHSDLKDVAEIMYFFKKCTRLQKLSFQFSPIKTSTKIVFDVISRSSMRLQELVLAPDPRLPAASTSSSLLFSAPQFASGLVESLTSKLVHYPVLTTLYLCVGQVAATPETETLLSSYLSVFAEGMPNLECLYLQWGSYLKDFTCGGINPEDFGTFKKLKHLCLSDPLISWDHLDDFHENKDLTIAREYLMDAKSKLCASLQQTMSIFYIGQSQLKVPVLYDLAAQNFHINVDLLDVALSVGFNINSHQPLFGTISLLPRYLCCTPSHLF
jgi:hypothetical protein